MTNPNDLNHRIGQRLRNARKGAGLSLAALSERLGGTLSKSRISNYEQGLRRMSIEVAEQLAPVLGATPAYLLCLNDDQELSSEEWRLIHGYRETDSRGKATIKAVIKTDRP